MPPARSSLGHVGGARAPRRVTRRDVDELERPRGEPLGERQALARTIRHVRYCGVDISAKPGNQQLVTLHERRARDGVELVATFYTPGRVERVARTHPRASAAARPWSPSTRRPSRRLDLLAAGAPRAPRSGCRTAATSACGSATRCSIAAGCRCTRSPPRASLAAGWEQWILVGFEFFAALAGLGVFRPPDRAGKYDGRVGEPPRRSARLRETYPDAIFCALLGHRPSPKRTPWGLQQRIAVLR